MVGHQTSGQMLQSTPPPSRGRIKVGVFSARFGLSDPHPASPWKGEESFCERDWIEPNAWGETSPLMGAEGGGASIAPSGARQ
ncbi:hypothetical protein ABIB57_004705 [Devosia sp. UYZn731]